MKTDTLEASRIMSHVNMFGDCWIWTGATTSGGYAQLGRISIHRWMHESFVGPVAGKVVMHSCDNPSCVKPTHLSTGTQSENLQDMARKMRNNTSILSVDQVKEIRARYVRTSHKVSNKNQLAEEYGVAPGTIKAIISRRLWSHI
jgi:hypothetical protein